MKLYNVPRNTKIRVLDDPNQPELLFEHIDGMYSVCYNSKNELVILAAWTQVEII